MSLDLSSLGQMGPLSESLTKLFPSLKVERDSGTSFSRIWSLINSPRITSVSRDISYLLVNNKLPVRERLFHVGLSNDPSCSVCPGSVVSDVTHFFCTCRRVCDVWAWIKQTISGIVGGLLSDQNLINYQIPSSTYDEEISWLLSSYIYKVWKEINYGDVNYLKKEVFFGYLRFKFKMENNIATVTMKDIPGLF